jgi:tetratricopeptide (TPR) repeat protein
VQLALAAAVLALVAVAAGGGLWVQHQAAEHRAGQARRDAEQRQAVEFALEKAAGLRQQAHWREAAAVLDQARQVLGAAGPDDLRRRLEVAQAELALVNRLDAIRQRRAMLVQGKFDTRTAEHDYAAAFREAGLGKVGDDEAAVAAQVAASEVAGPLLAALDDWAFVAEEARSVAWLLGVARRADPDPWRDRFHDPAVRQDRRALQALADEALRDDGAKLDELSPQVLGSLGALLGGGADAVPLLRAAQRRYPDDFWLGLKLGNALSIAKQGEEAVGYFRVAVALRPDAAAAHSNLGVTLAEKKDLAGAIAEFRTATHLDPRDANSHYNLGIALYVNKSLDEATAEFRTAIDLAPTHAYAHHNLGNALAAKSDLDGAIAEYKKAIDLNPKFAGAHGGLGTILRARQDLNGAITEFRKAIDIDPKDALAHLNLGNALRDKQDLDGAIAEFRMAVDCDPKLAPGHYSLGIALSDKKDLAGAIVEFRTAIDLDPRDASARYNLGIALYVKKDLDEAIAELRKAIDLNPKLAYAHGALGQALLDRGRFAEAGTATRRCLELLPQRDPFREAISQLVQECERLAALDEKLSAVLRGEAEPADAAERLALGQLCQQYKHRHATAVRFHTDAFATDPKLANDLQSQQRYSAACGAALAAAGQAEDALHLPDKVVVMLRRQALAWLRADLAQYVKMANSGEDAAREAVRQRLTHWQQDADLAPVRDKPALDRLPDDERQAWRQLWENVATLLKKVEEKK